MVYADATLAEKAIQAIQDRHITFVPEHWTTVCLDWLTHIEDWCISRQLWWGIVYRHGMA